MELSGDSTVRNKALARLRLRPTRRVDKCGSDRRFMTSSGRTSLKTDEGSKCLEGNTCTTGAEGMIAQSVAEIVSRHVKLAVEGIDRMYLNVFVPGLQYEQGIIRFFREHRGQPLPSAALMSPMTRSFVAKLEDFVTRQGLRWCNLARASARTR